MERCLYQPLEKDESFNDEFEEFFHQWKKKRTRTYISYLLHSLLDGLQTSMIAASLWIYLKSEVVFQDKKLLFGLICGAFNLNTILLGVVISRMADKSRKAWQLLISCTFLSLIGSILYIFPTSPYLLIIGRFLNGFIPTTRPIITAEVSRSYPSNELQKRLPLVSVFKTLGYAVGPIIALAFPTTKIWIGKFHLSYGHLCGLALIVLTILQLMVLSCLSHNLSEEYDLKANTEEYEIKETVDKQGLANEFENCAENTKGSKKDPQAGSSNNVMPLRLVIKNLLCNCNTLLILLLTLEAYFWSTMFYWCVPNLIMDIMGFDQEIVNIYYIVESLVLGLLAFGAVKMNFTDKGIFWIGISNFMSFVIVGVCIVVVYNISVMVVKIICLCIFSIGLAYLELGEKIFLIVSFAKMLRSENQGSGESFRGMLRRTGGLLGTSTALYLLEYFNYSFFVLAISITATLFCLILRRESFYNPKAVV